MTAPSCPVCSGPGQVLQWRGASLWCRCQTCSQLFFADGLGSLEKDLQQAAEQALNEI